ncbi:hypothetical protein IV73_GL001108 [Weissella kandleri]|uniref:N-acetyltransferase domain-containing protein n=1 Tax=Weissella kandleri TaxID=1616 RepID=A0A0R2JC07_9LACO|nr:GNAT family N-acetyltransferase [Weissella kandleri]KRN74831.1 hypothetical protein IV73_GL001108 [Weissella kandleri]
MDFWLEVATAQYAPAILQFLKQAQQESPFFVMQQDLAQITAAQLGPSLEQMAVREDYLMLLLINAQHEVGGMVTLAPWPNLAETLEIGVVVQARYQRQGLGQALLAEALDWVINYSVAKHVRLTVQERNQPAQKLYAKLGFVRIPNSEQLVLDGQQQQVSAYDMDWEVET